MSLFGWNAWYIVEYIYKPSGIGRGHEILSQRDTFLLSYWEFHGIGLNFLAVWDLKVTSQQIYCKYSSV